MVGDRRANMPPLYLALQWEDFEHRNMSDASETVCRSSAVCSKLSQFVAALVTGVFNSLAFGLFLAPPLLAYYAWTQPVLVLPPAVAYYLLRLGK